MTTDRSHLSSRNRHDRCGLPRQGDKLNLVSFLLRIDVNNGSNVTRLKALLAESRRQNH